MKTIVAIGEVLWDMLPAGRQVGGAPGNFAFHAQALGARARIISRVGNDLLGRELLEFYRRHDLSTDFITIDPSAPTGTVGVEIIDGQPCYTIFENVAWDRIEPETSALELLHSADALCFGSLLCRTESARNALLAMIAASPEKSLRVLDINLRPPFYSKQQLLPLLEAANVFKLNDDELKILSAMFACPETTEERQVRWFLERYDFQLIALTRGAHGSLLMSSDATASVPGQKVHVVDTVGAGDAFTAQIVIGFLAGLPLEEIIRRADELAAFVCTRPGALHRHQTV